MISDSALSLPHAKSFASPDVASQIAAAGTSIARAATILALLWIGGMKFTAYEAAAIQPMVANSPLLRWVYDVFDSQSFSSALGIVEIAIAIGIALRPVATTLAIAASGAAVLMFLTTLTFLFSTPGWEPTLGFPGLSVVPGQFLLKDAVLLGVALRELGEALRERCRGSAAPRRPA